MEIKRYTSFDQIEKELEILKLEKEINHLKLGLSFQKTKESFTLENIFRGLLDSCKMSFSNSYGSVLSLAIPYIIDWIKNKRGC